MQENKKTKGIKVIAYHSNLDENDENTLKRAGIKYIMRRPLKFSVIMNNLPKLVNKEVANTVNKGNASLAEKTDDILSGNKNVNEKIDIMVGIISNIQVFPFVITKVLQLADSSNSGANDLARVINSDPAIASAIIKLSNCVLLASSSHQITNIKEAIVRIGFNETKRMVITMKVMELFKIDDAQSKTVFSKEDFWLHCLLSGVIAEKIGSRVVPEYRNELFLIGLLHDFGMLLFEQFIPHIFHTVLDVNVQMGKRYYKTEKKVLGFNSLDVTADLFLKWKLPAKVMEVIRGYNAIQSEEKEFVFEETDILTSVLVVSDTIAKSSDIGRDCDSCTFDIPAPFLAKVGLVKGITNDFFEDTIYELSVFLELLQIDNPFKKREKMLKDKTGVFFSDNCDVVRSPILIYLNNVMEMRSVAYEDISSQNQKKENLYVVDLSNKAGEEKVDEILKGISDTVKKQCLFIVRTGSTTAKKIQGLGVSWLYNTTDLKFLEAGLNDIMDGIQISPHELDVSVSAETLRGSIMEKISGGATTEDV